MVTIAVILVFFGAWAIFSPTNSAAVEAVAEEEMEDVVGESVLLHGWQRLAVFRPCILLSSPPPASPPPPLSPFPLTSGLGGIGGGGGGGRGGRVGAVSNPAVEALAEEEVEDVVGESEQRLEADVKVAEAIQRAKNRAKAKDVAVEAEASSGLAEETGAEGAGEEDEQGVEVAGGEEGGIDSKLDFSSSSLFQPFPPSYRNLFLYSPAQFFFADLAAVEAAWDSEDAAAADPNVPAADLRTESSSSEFPPSSFLSLSLIPTSPSLSLLQFFSADLAAVEAAWDSEDAAAADPNVPAADLRTESTSSEAGSGLESQARESEEEARLDIREAATKKQESKKTEVEGGAATIHSSPESKEPPLMAGPAGTTLGRWTVEGGATIIQSSPESKEPLLMAGPVGQGTGEEGGGALPSLDLENAKFRWPSCGGNLMVWTVFPATNFFPLPFPPLPSPLHLQPPNPARPLHQDDFGEVEGGATIIQSSPESKEPPLMAGPVGQGTGEEGGGALPSLDLENAKFRWPSCGGNRTDWVPCLDNEKAIKALRTNKHYEHRERHCPLPGEMEKCLVPLPKGYKAHVPWPESRDQVWYDNVPHPGLASYKKDQNWVAMEGDKLVFPGGGTQFTHGATGYINFVQKTLVPFLWYVAWGIEDHANPVLVFWAHACRGLPQRGASACETWAVGGLGLLRRLRRCGVGQASARDAGHGLWHGLRRVRVMLDMGCGVASLSAYLDAFDVRVMSMAPKDEHEAQAFDVRVMSMAPKDEHEAQVRREVTFYQVRREVTSSGDLRVMSMAPKDGHEAQVRARGWMAQAQGASSFWAIGRMVESCGEGLKPVSIPGLEAFDVRVMSMAPKDGTALGQGVLAVVGVMGTQRMPLTLQIQLALERGVLAVVGVMGTQRLPFSSNSFDAVHCARCRVPWHIDGGWGIIPNQACVHALPLSLCLPFSSNSLMLFTALDAVCHGTLMVGGMLLLELNRVLRPGGFFIWSATPVYRHKGDDEEIWSGPCFIWSATPVYRHKGNDEEIWSARASSGRPDGEWEMENGRWGMGDGEWEMGNGRWGMGDGECEMGNGRWGMGDGEWEMGNGRWGMHVYHHKGDDEEIWSAMADLAQRMCWTLKVREKEDELDNVGVAVDLAQRMCWTLKVREREDGLDNVREKEDGLDNVGVAVWQKPSDNRCYSERSAGTPPPMCESDDNPDAAWAAQWPAMSRASLRAFPYVSDRLALSISPPPRFLPAPRYVPMKACLNPVPAFKGASRAVPAWLTNSLLRRLKGRACVADQLSFYPPPPLPLLSRYVPMKACLNPVPAFKGMRAAQWPAMGRARLRAVPAWLQMLKRGVFGGPAVAEMKRDQIHWKKVVAFYDASFGIDWGTVRNVMDMNAHYGGFAAELAVSKKPLWVLNVVPTSGPDSLPIVFERGLVGIYHDWCESFNSYPRSYDFLHADHTVSQEVGRCDITAVLPEMDRLLRPEGRPCDITSVLLEMDRLLRPEGWAVFRDHTRMGGSILNIATSFRWRLKFNKTEGGEVLLAFQKGFWRPKEAEEEAA
ncbi:unnamed protein product [Closterium sp. NIES-64]|nr:unnamed protein product [Closterium sp. NIES-64]